MSPAAAALLIGTWGPPQPLSDALAPDGTLRVPAGQALVLELPPGVAPLLRDPQGADVPTRGRPDGVLVVAAGRTRWLEVAVPDLSQAQVRWQTDRGAVAQWSRLLERLPDLDPDQPAATLAAALPWGGEALASELLLRQRAVTDPAVRSLGVAHDLALTQPLSEQTHRPEPPRAGLVHPDDPWTVDLVGPGTAAIELWTTSADGWSRHTLRLGLDGEAPSATPVAGSGRAPSSARVWIPPGAHTLSVGLDGDAAVVVTPWRLRAPLLHRRDALPTTGIDGAEAAWLQGQTAAARELFLACEADPGPAGALARARLSPPEDAPGLAEASAALRARSAVRPLGWALLTASSPDVAVGPAPQVLASREAAQATVWQALWPEGPAQEPGADLRELLRAGATRVLAPEGPGTPRLALGAGEQVALQLPARVAGRWPVLRLDSLGPTTYQIDGQTWVAAGAAPLDVALSPGAHTLAVRSGALLVLDPELAPDAAPLGVQERWLSPLPLVVRLPDPGVAAELQIALSAPALAETDDGAVVALTPGPDGLARLRAGPRATRLTLSGTGQAAVYLRAARGPDPSPPPAAPDAAAALAALTTLTQGIDAARRATPADPQAEAALRLDRARLLADLDQATLARRDAAAALALGGPHAAEAAALLRPGALVPSAATPGPRTAEAALALAAQPVRWPEAPEARAAWLSQLAEDAEAPEVAAALHLAAARAWLELGDLPQALGHADRPGGEALVATIQARLDLAPIPRVDRSAGLVEGARWAPGAPETLGEQVRAALLAAPWPAEEALWLRGSDRSLIRVPGGQVQVALYCRDERGPGADCAVDLRVDEAHTALDVADGATATITQTLAPGAHEIEISAPPAGMALGVRAQMDSALLPPEGPRVAIRATPRQPILATLAGGAVLRVRVTRGAGRLRLDGAAQRTALDLAQGEERWIPLTDPGPIRLEITGDLDVQLARGVAATRATPPPPPPPEPTAAAAPEVAAVFAQHALPASPDLPSEGAGGTPWAGLRVGRDALWTPVEPWTSAELHAGWARAEDTRRQRVEAWARGPRLAAGATGTQTWTWDPCDLGLGLDAGYGRGVAGQAGHVALDASGACDHALGPDLTLRGSLSARGGLWSPEPVGRVDPRAWSAWRAQHPALLSVGGQAYATLASDARAELGLRLDGAPWDLSGPLDRWSATARLDWLARPQGALRVDGAWTQRLGAAPLPSLGLSVDQGRWYDARRWVRIQAGARVWLQPEALARVGAAAWVSLDLLASPWRGLSDLPPGEVPFATLRGSP